MFVYFKTHPPFHSSARARFSPRALLISLREIRKRLEIHSCARARALALEMECERLAEPSPRLELKSTSSDTARDRCNCWCCDLMVHPSTCAVTLPFLPLTPVSSLPPLARSSFGSLLLRFRFHSIKPALQLATGRPTGASSRKLRVQFVSYLTHHPPPRVRSFSSFCLPLSPSDINPDRCNPGATFSLFSLGAFAMFRVQIMTAYTVSLYLYKDSVRKGAEVHGFVKFLTEHFRITLRRTQ